LNNNVKNISQIYYKNNGFFINNYTFYISSTYSSKNFFSINRGNDIFGWILEKNENYLVVKFLNEQKTELVYENEFEKIRPAVYQLNDKNEIENCIVISSYTRLFTNFN
jgi:hypothetical protein